MRETSIAALRCVSPILTLFAAAPAPAEAQAGAVPLDPPVPVHLERAEGRVLVRAGEEAFTEYHFTGATKPHLHPLLAPGGRRVTRAWPMEQREGEGRDHPHQRSLWFAHGDVNGHDFWHEGGERIVLDGEPVLSEAEGAATVRARQRWLAPDATLVCTEERTMIFRAWKDRRAIDFELCIEAPAERELVFGDTKEGTFGLRLATEFALAGAGARGHALSSEGKRDGECWGSRARWMAYWAAFDGGELGVAVFDHPQNPAHPTRWHARDYGLFAANPFGLHDFEGAAQGAGAFTVAAGASVSFRYRVLVYAGAAAPEGSSPERLELLEREYRAYAL